jgi:hypothetical protein
MRGLNPGGAIFSLPIQTYPGANPDFCKWYRVRFPRLKQQGVALSTHSHLAPILKIDNNYNSTLLLGFHNLHYRKLYFAFTFILKLKLIKLRLTDILGHQHNHERRTESEVHLSMS